MHLGIQSLLNELQPEVPFEQYDFGSPELAPTTPADLHTYMTEMFRIHFQAQPTSATDLHDGSLQWDDILTGTYDDFQRRHSGLNIPPAIGDRPDTLHALW